MVRQRRKRSDPGDRPDQESDPPAKDAEGQGDPPSQDVEPALPISMMPSSPGGDGRVVAMGMNLMMQRSSFDSLSPEIQSQMIDMTGVMDERGYEFACQNLSKTADMHRLVLKILAGFAGGLILVGAALAYILIQSGKFDQAMTLITTGVAVVGALLGGAGLRSVLRSFSGSG